MASQEEQAADLQDVIADLTQVRLGELEEHGKSEEDGCDDS